MSRTHQPITRPYAKWILICALGLIIIWAPLPLGSNRAWSVGILAVALAACLPLAVWAFWDELPRYFRLIKVPAAGFAILFAYIQLQAAFGFGDLDDLLRAELGFAAAGMAFLIAFLLAATASFYARVLLGIFLFACVLYSAYGLMEALNPGAGILWFDVISLGDGMASTFVNRNSFATYTGFGLVTAFALLLTIPRIHALRDLGIAASGSDGSSRALNNAILLFAIIIAMTAALFLSLSRAGILATGAAVLVFAGLSIRRKAFQWRTALASGAILIVVLGALLLGTGGDLLARFGDLGLDGVGRFPLFDATLHMIADAPLFGHGFGSFETTFPAFRPEALPPFPDYDKAHNGYLEIIAGLGIPMGVLFISLYGWMAWRCVKGLTARRQGLVFSRLGIALTVLAGLHSLVDFSLQIPAVGVTYAFLMGICVGQSYPRHARAGAT